MKRETVKPLRLFGLNETQLLSVIETAAGTPIARVTHVSPPSDPDKGLATVAYMTAANESGTVSVFAKQCVWENRAESVHYQYLTAQGVPMPRVYGAFRVGDGPEILFLEPLTAIGYRKDSVAEWQALLTLIARFNACPIDPNYLPQLHPYEQVGRIDENHWITGLTAFPTDDAVAMILETCGVRGQEIPRLVSAARSLFARVAVHPKGLLHQDFLPDNFGWRGERAEMVVFDVPKNALGPRFADVAPYLFASDWAEETAAYLTDGPQGTTLHKSLIQHYLDEYARLGGSVVSADTFHQEILELFWAHKVTALGWLSVEDKESSGCVREVLQALAAL